MAPPTHLFDPVIDPRPDGGDLHENGAAISKLFREGGPGTTVLLRPGKTYVIYSQVDLSHPGTTLATEGYPEFSTGQQAILETRGEKEAGAVRLFQLPRTALKRVHVRGCRGWGPKAPTPEEAERWKKEGRLGWIEGGGALIWAGGPEAYEQTIEGCRIEDPRGWTGLHLVDFAQRCRVINNIVGPCGQQAPGPWADGLSIAGKDSIVTGNTIFDATDGAIVLFCAPGTLCSDNTVIARTRNCLGAINMVDDFPFQRDYTETRVISNVIRTEGAYFRVAIACGPTSWSPWGPHHVLNFNGQVLHNTIGPGQFGYGITLSGVKNWTVLGNVIAAGTRFAGSTRAFYPNILNCPPAAFVRNWLDRGRVQDSQDLQPDFIDGELQWVIGIEPEVGDKLEYEQGQVSLDVRGHSRAGEGGIALRDARWEVSPGRGGLVLRKVEGPTDAFGMGEYGRGKVLWSSGTPLLDNGNGHHHVYEPQLDFRLDGTLTLRTDHGTGQVLWDPVSYLVPYLSHLPSPPPHEPIPSEPQPPEKWLPHARLVLQNKQPYLELRERSGGNVVFATAYEYSNQDAWNLKAGQWIAIAPKELRGTVDPHHLDEQEAATSSSVPPPDHGSVGPPPIPPRHGSGHFSRFVHDLGTSLQQRTFGGGGGPPPPPIPPRPDGSSNPQPPPQPEEQQKAPTPHPTFLYLSPETCQLFLHSSPNGPTQPDPSSTHWCSAPAPPESNAKDPWLTFQGDGNVVMYSSAGVLFASGTNGDREAKFLRLKGFGEDNGPSIELVGVDGHNVWSSR
ncbi:hypothetical protein C6P46_000267 [Rhodotorula mucilaginosa]|uniref:Right handed beta helix domain-containing protein n=1 Tax=Rhodotorula mucilaginosa TaxID=5537 RepID=A0A9P6W5I9_RHOMI|nr:hypothetical protein C6P46_000267 [Rhodotorula mucilaginosa]TKA52138.1 hypothetical protein B0A53_04982 [Rhodotorula sp. CCFEE 5036]